MGFEIENGVLKKCREKDGIIDITIPDSITSIGEKAVEWCKNLKSITIPDSVKSIGISAFRYCGKLESITIPESVTSISNGTFDNCTSLTGITIPNSVTSIGDNAFSSCKSLTDITIPDSVTSIGKMAFYYCKSLKNITIPDSVTSIGDGAFFHCESLTSITIPDSVTSIGNDAFGGTKRLENIDVSEKNKNFCSCDGVLYSKDMTMIIRYPEGKQETEFIIPDSVTSISNNAFSPCGSLTSITIPDSVTSIGNCTFDHCKSLTGITIPNSVTSIGNRAFMSCESLESVTILDGVISIGDNAFFWCKNLKSITIPDSVKNIGICAFQGDTKIIFLKGDLKLSFILKNNWKLGKQEVLLNDFIFDDVNNRQKYFDEMELYYKIPLALFMLSAYPQETYYSDYLKNNAEDAVICLIDEEYIELLYRFLEFGFITEKNIDSLISYAVKHTQNGGSSEPQIVLSKYKSDNFSSKGVDSFDKLML